MIAGEVQSGAVTSTRLQQRIKAACDVAVTRWEDGWTYESYNTSVQSAGTMTSSHPLRRTLSNANFICHCFILYYTILLIKVI